MWVIVDVWGIMYVGDGTVDIVPLLEEGTSKQESKGETFCPDVDC